MTDLFVKKFQESLEDFISLFIYLIKFNTNYYNTYSDLYIFKSILLSSILKENTLIYKLLKWAPTKTMAFYLLSTIL